MCPHDACEVVLMIMMFASYRTCLSCRFFSACVYVYHVLINYACDVRSIVHIYLFVSCSLVHPLVQNLYEIINGAAASSKNVEMLMESERYVCVLTCFETRLEE
jgi:hypothetical protein